MTLCFVHGVPYHQSFIIVRVGPKQANQKQKECVPGETGFPRTLSVAEGLEGRLVTELVLARLHDERQTGVDALAGLDLLLVDGSHC